MKRLIKRPEVEQKTGLSRTGIYRLIESGGFPAPIKLSRRSVAWPEAEIDQWIDARIAESRGDTGAAA